MSLLVRVLGIDPGTMSFDLCGLKDRAVFLDLSIPTKRIARNPNVLLRLIRKAGRFDLIVGPSGYGLPLTHAREVWDREGRLMLLRRPDDVEKRGAILRLGRIVGLLKKSGMNVCFIPGVIHLPTVPIHRKANKIDMGTADKLCSAVLAIHDQSTHLGIDYESTSFILGELGYAYNAFLAVQGGKVVDGIGGTLAGPGFLSLGAMDGELAYLLKSFNKALLFTGGVRSISGKKTLTPEEFSELAKSKPRHKLAWEAFMEGVEKSVATLSVSNPTPREILLSGRLSRSASIREELVRRLSKFGPVRQVQGFARISKEAAQGAAIIGDGLVGGRFRALVEIAEIRKASGTVLDNIYVEGAGILRRDFRLN